MYINKRILILCEDGKSSIGYFKAFKKDEELKRMLQAVDIEVYQPTDHSPMGLVREAKEKLKKSNQEDNPYDVVWVCFDKNGHSNIKQAFTFAKRHKIEIAFSNICFEYWILLHFVSTTRNFKNCDAIISHIKNKFYPDYNKKDTHFDNLKLHLSQAINHCKILNINWNIDIENDTHPVDLSAYCNVHSLILCLFPEDSNIFN